MSAAIFISYRRQDSEAEARALFERMCLVFGPQQVFIDLQGIPIGRDFVDVLGERLEGCRVLLAVIGERWTGADPARGAEGARILQDTDFVRMEVRAALQRGVAVIPVLVGRAGLPTAEQLPEDLHPLLRLNAAPVRMASFDSDVRPLVEAIRPRIASPAPQGGSARWSRKAMAAGLAGVGLAATATYVTSSAWMPLFGSTECRAGASTQGFLNPCRQNKPEDATMLRMWPAPLSWEAGQAPLRIPVKLNHYSYDDYKQLEVPRESAIPATAVKELRGIDEAARKILTAHMDKVPRTIWYAKLGLEAVPPVPETHDQLVPLLNVRYLSEWQRHAFNKPLATDHYRGDGKLYAEQRRAWFAKPDIEFPAFLFSEFLVLSNDPDGGRAVLLTKGEKAPNGKRGSMLADILDDVVLSTSIETSPRIGPGIDFVYDATQGVHQIDITSTVGRGLDEIGFKSLEDARVKRIVNYGVAFHEGLMNAALLSIVWLDRSCEQIQQVARDSIKNTAVECVPPDAAGRYLTLDQSGRRWHPTARLRLALWRAHLDLQNQAGVAKVPTARAAD